MFRSTVLFLLSLACINFPPPLWASVLYVSGDQTGTWSADTVIVTGEVRVPPGQSLTILPGVEVLFSVYCKLIVDNGATLRAVGTAADFIRFDVLPPNTNWHGVRFLSASDSSRLVYCLLTNGSATGDGDDLRGGAIYCSSSHPTIGYCLIEGCEALMGGAIYCTSSSSPTIRSNTISGNSATQRGGGISCWYSSPIISGNAISGNSAHFGGGIHCYYNSSPTISGNAISGNSAIDQGGGINCYMGSNAIISGNTISENSGWDGGGIHCFQSSPSIFGNTISGNSAAQWGGGGVIFSSALNNFTQNKIRDNTASIHGGGLYLGSSNLNMNKNTICNNRTANGGGLYCTTTSSATLSNCILWGNRPNQIYGTSNVTYTDIQGGYTGIGNINTYPAFVDTAQDDYRLQWGSPCIDSGDPNPIYNDPDLTRADMGAWYYDQSIQVRILLTPYNAPIQIPATGGSFQYALHLTNIGTSVLQVTGWCNVTLPNGSTYGPVLGPVPVSVGSGQTLSRLRTQTVPASAPAGLYHYNAFAVAAGDTSTDSFVFTKSSVRFGESDLLGGWTNTGEELGIAVGALLAAPQSRAGQALPLKFGIVGISPNPFNPTTTIRFDLPEAAQVSLEVFDINGRVVGTQHIASLQTGTHEITFDGSDLPSGIYFARLTMSGAGSTTLSGKMVLLK